MRADLALEFLRRAPRAALPASGVLLAAALSTGCWEQVSREWFAQMKEQPAVQALEATDQLAGRSGRPFEPPVGTIPYGGLEPRIDFPIPAFSPEAQTLVNPIPSSPESIDRGKYVFEIYCSVCHGMNGMANPTTPVGERMAQSGMPVPPLAAVPGYKDGFIFTKIRYGKPGMPGYPQIPPRDRWNVVNYLRTLIPGKAG